MGQVKTITQKLEQVADKLARRGQDDLAEEVGAVVRDLQRNAEQREAEVMTTGEAAAALGVRSVFTVKRWAREGILDGFRRGGRILITRESVERLLNNPKVAEQRVVEAELEAFDADDESLPKTSWSGRKPWEYKMSGVDDGSRAP